MQNLLALIMSVSTLQYCFLYFCPSLTLGFYTEILNVALWLWLLTYFAIISSLFQILLKSTEVSSAMYLQYEK